MSYQSSKNVKLYAVITSTFYPTSEIKNFVLEPICYPEFMNIRWTLVNLKIIK